MSKIKKTVESRNYKIDLQGNASSISAEEVIYADNAFDLYIDSANVHIYFNDIDSIIKLLTEIKKDKVAWINAN